MSGFTEEACEECGEPCSPDNPCPECEQYWLRMVAEGYWINGSGWTEKALREMKK
jgi:hypothetical protein